MKTVLLTVVIPPEETVHFGKDSRLEERIEIELPLEVVRTMYGLTGHVAGADDSTYRKHTEAFKDAVEQAPGLASVRYWDRFDRDKSRAIALPFREGK